jgi:hypothetical protein
MDNHDIVAVLILPVSELDSTSNLQLLQRVSELENTLDTESARVKDLQSRLNALTSRNNELELIAQRSKVRDLAWKGIIGSSFPLLPGLSDVNTKITNLTISRKASHNNKSGK